MSLKFSVRIRFISVAALAAALFFFGNGCDCYRYNKIADAILPARMRIHPFSNIYDGSPGGIDARVEMQDKFGDSLKAYGSYRFEVYRPGSGTNSPRGKLLATWTVDISDPQKNFVYWDKLSRCYRFKLSWDGEAPEIKKLVLDVIFTAPEGFGKRLFVSGEVAAAAVK